MSIRRKSLLIGINYTGTRNQLAGCINDAENMAGFLVSRGYSMDNSSMVVLTDLRSGPYYASGRNIIAAMDWLVSEPNTCLFLHYSGHGGQIPDRRHRSSGVADTIVPADWERNGQIDSGTLHRHLVSALPRNSTLFIIFDCCHSGSALELPFVYRTDEYGNVNMMDSLKMGYQLYGEAKHLIQGDFGNDTGGEAEHLLGAATDFFRGLRHQYSGEPSRDGLTEADEFDEGWSREEKSVFMFSGCKDEQTSADAFINGKHVGAMSWAFLQCMRRDYNWDMSYVQILQDSRELLQEHYSQVPQLSCGYQFDLNRSMRI